jgi:hypothetical protein
VKALVVGEGKVSVGVGKGLGEEMGSRNGIGVELISLSRNPKTGKGSNGICLEVTAFTFILLS